jgi:hypothetical protein
MAIIRRMGSPRGGGSAEDAVRYILGGWNDGLGFNLPPSQVYADALNAAVEALCVAADTRDDLGVGEVIHTGRDLPSAVYCEGVTALSSASAQIDSISSVQSRIVSPIIHDVISFNEDETETLSDEQVIAAAQHFLTHSYNGHAFVAAVHRNTAHLHVHTITAAINSGGLPGMFCKASKNGASSWFKYAHRQMRETEVALGLQHDRGLYVVDESDGDKYIRPASKVEMHTWKGGSPWGFER